MKLSNEAHIVAATKLMRKLGVLHLKTPDLELLLGPEPVEPIKEPKKSLDEILEGGKKRKGADGRTADEQTDLYGAVLDAEE